MRKKVLFLLLFVIGTGLVFSSAANCTREEWEDLEIFTFSDPRKNLEEALSVLENKEKIYGKDALELCQYLEKTGDEYQALHEHGKGIECFERSLRLKSKKDVIDMTIDNTRMRLANLYFHKGYYAKSEKMLLKVLDHQLETSNEGSSEVAQSRYSLAILYRLQGRFDEARDLYEQVIPVLKRHNDPDLPYGLKDYAFLNLFEGKFEQAEKLFEQALKSMEEREKKEGKNFLDVPTFMAYLANSIAVRGRFEEAEMIYQQLQEMIRKRYGDGRFHEKIFHLAIGRFYRNWGRPMEAEVHYRYVASIFFFIGIVPDMTFFLEEIAAFYREQGRFDEAEIILLKAKEAIALVYGVAHPSYAAVLNKQGVLYREWGRMADLEEKYELSEKYLNECLEKTSNLVTEIHPSRICLLHELAILYHYQERLDEAESFYRKALNNYVKAFGPRFVKLRQLLLDLAILCRTRGNLEEATELEKWACNIPDIAKWVE